MLDFIYIILGLIILFVGGELLLKGSISVSISLNISKILVSSIIIGFGTSMPELAVSIGASLKGSSDLVLGNIVGSNISNTLLIVGIAATIYPLIVLDPKIKREAYWMLFSVLILIILVLFDFLNLISGILLIIVLLAYISLSIVHDKKNKNNIHEHIKEDAAPPKPYKLYIAISFVILGMLLLPLGAHLLVTSAINIAKAMGISEAIIGLTIVAVGTSLPEISTALVASYKKHNDVVAGNILGSSIFNILFILGVTFIIKPIEVAKHIIDFDIWLMLVACLFISIMLIKKYTITRSLGVFMILCYAIYSTWLYIT